ncbi:MAG: hypothetical protein KUG83_10685 [Gammaproteobacteria bacterium]|nr:hypothetical protein [Gammaproteobacteria bacterium]
MSSYESTIGMYSSAVSEQSRIAIFTVFFSMCIGSFVGLQILQYVDIMCAVRGTCYGNEGFAHNASLMHPLAISLFFSSVVLIATAWAVKSLAPFRSLIEVSLISESTVNQIKQAETVLLFVGGVFLLFSLSAMFLSMLV